MLTLQGYFDSACTAKAGSATARNRKVIGNFDDIFFVITAVGNGDYSVIPFSGIGYIECFWRRCCCIVRASNKPEA
jgi:hypothetical protein